MCHHVTYIVASRILLQTMCIHIAFHRTLTATHVWTLLATLPPLVHNEDPAHPAHNELATTNSSTETVSAWDLRHHTYPGHAPACNHPVASIQTRSRIRPELMPYQRSESVRDSRPRRGHMIRTRSQIPHRSLASPVCRLPHWIPDPLATILRMWLICRICI